MNIKDLTWDQSIYPRAARSQKTVSAYVEALDIGAQFPPIKIQRVFNYTDEHGNEKSTAAIILDGIHRWTAFIEKGLKQIKAVEWKDQPLDYQENRVELLLESARCNIGHGDRLSANDKKRIARDIASTDPEYKYTENALAQKLFYFTKPGDLILDPMAGGGVVPDVCLLFERKCQAFDLAAGDNRPEIEHHHWNPQKSTWPVTKKEYESFFKDFFTLAHKNSKPTTTLAFLNADWRNFESTPAAEEKPDKSITIFDFHKLLSKTGWKTTKWPL